MVSDLWMQSSATLLGQAWQVPQFAQDHHGGESIPWRGIGHAPAFLPMRRHGRQPPSQGVGALSGSVTQACRWCDDGSAASRLGPPSQVGVCRHQELALSTCHQLFVHSDSLGVPGGHLLVSPGSFTRIQGASAVEGRDQRPTGRASNLQWAGKC